MTTRVDVTSEDFYGRLSAETREIIEGATPEIGQRHQELIEVAFRCAEIGATNSEICDLLTLLSLKWGKYPNNTFQRWTHILNLIRMVRKEFPNTVDGTGYHAG